MPIRLFYPDHIDTVLYVSYGDFGSCNSGAAAYAGACSFDQFGRPVTGQVNICTSMIDGIFWKKDVMIMVHEIGHVLIMSSGLWDQFRDSNGNPYSNIIRLLEKQII